MTEENRPVVLCKPMDLGQLALVQGVLEAEEIDYFIENENMSVLHGGMMGLQSVVVVNSRDWEAASAALETLVGYKA